MRDLRYKNPRNRIIKIGSQDFDLGSRTFLMGILNLTPDSFSDGGEFNQLDFAMSHAMEMIDNGADIIDVGGESTRPGSLGVSVEEEISRVIPFIHDYKLKFPKGVPISLDTSKSLVAEKGLEAGADLINDVWGFQKDRDLARVCASYKVPVVLMHNSLSSMYSLDIMEELKLFFKKSVEIALGSGVKTENIILDPGIGFGKTQEHNREILTRLGELKDLGFPILLGTSRKSVIGTILNLPPKDRIEGTLATTVMGIISGVDFVRVHDILENKRACLVTDKIVRG